MNTNSNETREKRMMVVETATALGKMDGYDDDDNEFLEPYVNGEKSIEELIEEEIKS